MPKPWWWTASGQPSASTNFDNRSFALNEELNLIVYNVSSARQLEEAFEQDLKYSKQITYAEWNSRGIGARICELFAFSGQRIPRSKNTYDVRFRGATNQGAHGVFLIQRNLVQ